VPWYVNRTVPDFKITIVDEDGAPYHLIFSQDNAAQHVNVIIHNIMSHSLWLSSDAIKKIMILNRAVFNLKDKAQSIAFAKANYRNIAKLRDEIEGIVAKDFLELHNVKRFLQDKRTATAGFKFGSSA
jgi:hypothetical protein